MDGADAVTPDQRSPGAKLSLLLEGKSLPEDQKSEWIRRHGQSKKILATSARANCSADFCGWVGSNFPKTEIQNSTIIQVKGV